MSLLAVNNFAARLVARFSRQPVYRLIVISLLLVTLLPMAFIGYQLYQQAWENAWREVNEKHRLLAENLASPIKIYIDDHSNMLKLLASSIQQRDHNSEHQQYRLNDIISHMDGFRSLALLDTDGMLISVAISSDINLANEMSFADEETFISTRASLKAKVSHIKSSPVTGQPTIILSAPVFKKDNSLGGILLGELDIQVIEKLRKNIQFGEKGHSAIVDSLGHVVAHPNPGWMTEMRDLSHLPVVQKMMMGDTGVTEFYSPFIKQNMVAGYTAVPEIGWGIMVPQPKSEVEKQVNQLLSTHLKWGIAGLILAMALAIPIVLWITRPLKYIAQTATEMAKSPTDYEIPVIADNAPREVSQLCNSFRTLVHGLQVSHNTINTLNKNLQNRVDEATEQLRDSNERLTSLATKDYLTELSNRRHFEMTMKSILKEPPQEILHRCMMLIDLDNFKEINDQYGHAAGDEVLLQIATLLKSIMRPGDLVARYGGDEFVVQMQCPPEIGRKRAEDILEDVAKFVIEWQGWSIHTSVSIGLLHWKHTGKDDMDQLLRKADKAMYEAKQRGRNQYAEMYDTPDAA